MLKMFYHYENISKDDIASIYSKGLIQQFATLMWCLLGTICKVCWKLLPETQVVLQKGMSHSPVRSLMHLSMPSNTGRGVIGASSKPVHFLHFLSNFTIWCNTAATAIIVWDWHFESGVDGPTEYQQYDCNSSPCCNFCLVATCNCPIPYIVKKECFSSSSWASWDEIVLCNWRGFFNRIQNFLKDPSLLFIKLGFSLICFNDSLVLVNDLVIDNNILS